MAMSQCVHDFKRNPDGEVICARCGGKDDEMESDVQTNQEAAIPVDFWATQTSFE